MTSKHFYGGSTGQQGASGAMGACGNGWVVGLEGGQQVVQG